MPPIARSIRVSLSVAVASMLVACASQPSTPLATTSPASVDTVVIEVPDIQRPEGETADWWFRNGAAAAVRASRQAHADAGNARNVIVFLGDGMSIPTIAAAHVRAGQLKGVDGESYRLSFEKFPFIALSRTYETDQQVADSAGTMSAIMTGAKTRAGYISVDQKADTDDCATLDQHKLVTMLELAKAGGLAAGVVSTARITHATPAATYGHLPERGWEIDAAMPEQARAAGCKDFAAQLVEFSVGGGIDVAMGGGRSAFLPASTADPERPDKTGHRADGRNLADEWQQRYPQGAYVWNAQQLEALDLDHTQRLLGLFDRSHMDFEHDRRHDRGGEPSLAGMTRAALEILQRDPDGFFLMVEGGRIDHALHGGNAFRALDETISLADAVQVALDMTDPENTLIVVTSDHSHSMTFAGYPVRGNDILGLVREPDGDGGTELGLDALGKPYTTLGFANGPGYLGATDAQPEGPKHGPHSYEEAFGITDGRSDLSEVDTTDPDYLQEATLPLHSETHGGEDVAVFAHGPGAAAFHGEIEQNTIFHIIVQHAPALRAELCRLDACNDAGVPVDRPRYGALMDMVGETPR